MNYLGIFSLFLLLVPWSVRGDQDKNSLNFELLSYYQTSLSPGADSLDCVIEGSCKKGWLPKASGSARLEGLFLRLRQPLILNRGRGDDRFKLAIEFADPLKIHCTKDDFEVFYDGVSLFPETRESYNPQTQKREDKIYCSVGSQSDIGDVDEVGHREITSIFIKWNHSKIQPAIKRVFLLERLDPTFVVQGSRKGFFTIGETNDGRKSTTFREINFILPNLAPLLTVKASSQLEPFDAYQPANLFDSQEKFAFSFNGNKNSGIKESLEFEFEKATDIDGLMIWNGYQRSPSHFYANGRIQKMTLSSPGQPDQNLDLKDLFGPQEIRLLSPIRQVKKLSLQIKSIFPGAKYKDLLISELKFIDKKGHLIQPILNKKEPFSSRLNGFLDRTWTSKLSKSTPKMVTQSEVENKPFALTLDKNTNESFVELRLRSNGTFVIYRTRLLSMIRENKDKVENGKVQDRRVHFLTSIFEGNWTEESDQIRIFGRKYQANKWKREIIHTTSSEEPESSFRDTSYNVLDNQDSSDSEEGIFQSTIKFRKFSKIPVGETDNILKILKAQSESSDLNMKNLKTIDPFIFESGPITSALVEVN
jgi:hypothetical protein